jgi:hypothetical protein
VKITLEEMNKVDGRRLRCLRDLCGFVENGSSTVVKIFQDDATRTWFVEVGGKSYFAGSFHSAVDAAIAANPQS